MTMRPMAIAVLICAALTGEISAQVAVELSYGTDRNVDSAPARRDGWLNGTVEWMFPSGLGIGIGTDHQFRNAAPSVSDYLALALYLSTSFEFSADRVAPFVRAGIGLGRAPCQGDTCSDGAYLRGSTGLRIRLTESVRLSGELGISRVSRPFGGVGLALLFW